MTTTGILVLWAAIVAFWAGIALIVRRHRERHRDDEPARTEAGFVA